ncbi:MAG: hypothetical protein KDD69_01795 [Bdellovibrionales bacterium]|nr:hypothetical protein [Bdellovibrionales bacterium]
MVRLPFFATRRLGHSTISAIAVATLLLLLLAFPAFAGAQGAVGGIAGDIGSGRSEIGGSSGITGTSGSLGGIGARPGSTNNAGNPVDTTPSDFFDGNSGPRGSLTTSSGGADNPFLNNGFDNPFDTVDPGENLNSVPGTPQRPVSVNDSDDIVDDDFAADDRPNGQFNDPNDRDVSFLGDPLTDRSSLIGFFNTVVNDFNFLELVNLSRNTIRGEWVAVDFDGRDFSRPFTIEPQRRADFDLHSNVGGDRFGYVLVSHNGSPGEIVGNVSQYGNTNGSMNFAVSQPLRRVFGQCQ